MLPLSLSQDCLDINRKTVYDLISSHGAVDDMVFFATRMEGRANRFGRHG